MSIKIKNVLMIDIHESRAVEWLEARNIKVDVKLNLTDEQLIKEIKVFNVRFLFRVGCPSDNKYFNNISKPVENLIRKSFRKWSFSVGISKVNEIFI